MKIEITHAEQNQLAIVHEVMRTAFEEYRGKLTPESGALTESLEDIQRKFTTGGAILAWKDHQPLASAQYSLRQDYMYIGRLSVLKEARGYGVGSRMMNYLEHLALEHNLHETRIGVRLSIPENVSFYERIGYDVLEEKEYPDKTDRWYVMGKRLRATQ